MEHFDSNRATVSWVGSLLAGVYLMSGPIVGGLVNKFGCRPVCILGSIVACIGLCLSTLSPNVPVLMLTYGVMGKICALKNRTSFHELWARKFKRVQAKKLGEIK